MAESSSLQETSGRMMRKAIPLASSIARKARLASGKGRREKGPLALRGIPVDT